MTPQNSLNDLMEKGRQINFESNTYRLYKRNNNEIITHARISTTMTYLELRTK